MTATVLFADWDDAQLVEAARGQEPQAFGELFERWYDRCYDVAWGICRDRETAADVAQETFCACWERLPDLRDAAAFGGWVLRATRNHALNRLERDRIRRHDPIDAEEPMAIPDPAAGPDAQVEQDETRQLVWTAAAVLGERDTSLLDLHLRHGLGATEIADELAITPNNASQLLHRLRGQLRDTIGAVLLWRRGRPACGALARLVGAREQFDAEVSTVIRRHRRACPSCSTEVIRRRPELLFASMPVALASVALKEQARSALAQAGVPMLTQGAPVAAAAVPPADGGTTAGSGIASGAAQSLPFAGKALVPALAGAVVVAGLLGVLGSGLLPHGSGPGPVRDAAGAPPAAGPAAPDRSDPVPSLPPDLTVALVAQRDGTTAGVAGAIGSSGARTDRTKAASSGPAAPSARRADPGSPGGGSPGGGSPGGGSSGGAGGGPNGGQAPAPGSTGGGPGGDGRDAGSAGSGHSCPPGWVPVRGLRFDHGHWVVWYGCSPFRPWWPGPRR